MGFSITRKLSEYRRVLQFTKKPTLAEVKATVKITAIGTAIIGAIGFVINMIANLINGL